MVPRAWMFTRLPGGDHMGVVVVGAEARAGGFGGTIEPEGSGIIAMTWQGHIDAIRLREHLHDLEAVIADFEPYFLRVDATHVSGYDLDAHAQARRWATRAGRRPPAAVAIIAGSHFAAVESPAFALAAAGRARFFASAERARRWLQAFAVSASGEYVLASLLPPRALSRP